MRPNLFQCQYHYQSRETFGGPTKHQGNGRVKRELIAMTTFLVTAQQIQPAASHLVEGQLTTLVRQETSLRQMQHRICNVNQNTSLASVQVRKASSILVDAKMINDIRVGDRVKVLGLPGWLIYDLPDDEQTELRAFVGQTTVVRVIDSHGYFWLGFGTMFAAGDSAYYSGHSFCLPREFIELSDETTAKRRKSEGRE